MNGFWQRRGGRLLPAAVVIGLAAVALASITFEANGRFSGFDGCNRFSGRIIPALRDTIPF